MADSSVRLLTLLSLLQTQRDWAGQLLAERLGVSPRTVRRDVEHLRTLGYRVRTIKGPDGGYRLDAGSVMPPLLFDDDQAVAIAVALQSAAGTGLDMDEAASRALATLRQVLPARIRYRIDQIQVTTMPTQAALEPPARMDVLTAVSAARDARNVLRFDYEPVDASAPSRVGARPREAEPHHVIYRDGRWYVVGWDLMRDDWRIYRLDRMQPRVPAGRRFAPREVPGGNVDQFVTARFKGASGAATWPCRGEVVLALPAETVAPYIEDGWVERLGADRCRLQKGSWSWVALAAWIGRFDADIETAEPLELRQAFEVLARRYATAADERGPILAH